MNKEIKKRDKWNPLIGCFAICDSKGKLNILRYMQVIKLPHSPSISQFMVVGFEKGHVILTVDGGIITRVKKRDVKIV